MKHSVRHGEQKTGPRFSRRNSIIRRDSVTAFFLEIFTASLPKWELTFIKMDHGYPVDIGRTYIHEDTKELAREIGTKMLKNYGADYLEVVRVV